MKQTKRIVIFTLAVLVAGLITGCRGRLSRSVPRALPRLRVVVPRVKLNRPSRFTKIRPSTEPAEFNIGLNRSRPLSRLFPLLPREVVSARPLAEHDSKLLSDLGPEAEELYTAGRGQNWAQVRQLTAKVVAKPELPTALRSTFQCVETQADRLTHLQALEAAIAHRWEHAPDVDRLEQHLAVLLDRGQDVAVVVRTQRYLAWKAALEGYPEAGKRLLPPESPADDTLTKLRDLKTLLAREEELGSAKIGKAVPKDITSSLLLPEANAGGFRPSPRESALTGFPALGPKNGSSSPDRSDRNVPDLVHREAEESRLAVNHHLHLLHQFGMCARTLADSNSKSQPKDSENEVANRLGRRLSLAERTLAERMKDRGKTNEAIAAALRRLSSISN